EVFNLGNGNNTATASVVPGGLLRWTSGNGTNSLTLGGAATPANSAWNVGIRFGNADDTLTLSAAAPATQSLTGSADGGGRILGNVFSQGASWTLTTPFILTNFP